MALMVEISPRIGQIVRYYRKQAGLTQHALGDELERVLASRGSAHGTGISKSTISRIEKGTFLPPQNKLEIICELVAIPLAERQELFTLCGYSAPPPPDTLLSRIEELNQKVQAQPGDVLTWLELVSLLNQERQFNAMQRRVSEALFQFDLQPTPATPVSRAILLAKQQIGQALADRDGVDEADCLRLSLQFSTQALKALHSVRNRLDPELAAGLQAEALRTELAASYRTLIRELAKLSWASVQQRFKHLKHLLDAFEQVLERLPNGAYRRELSLYTRRERVSIEIKQIESFEQHYFSRSLLSHWPTAGNKPSAQALTVLTEVLNDGAQRLQLSALYRIQDGQLIPAAADETLDFKGIRAGLDAFLDTQRALLHDGLSPEQLPASGVLNTLLLYVSALARLQSFSGEGELLLKSLYLLANHQTLAAWNYVAAVFYACRYLLAREQQDLDAWVTAWMSWCQSSIHQPKQYNSHRFYAILHEPYLWVACLDGLTRADWNSPCRHWLEPKLMTLITSTQERP